MKKYAAIATIAALLPLLLAPAGAQPAKAAQYPEHLPTGMSITPLAAPGSTLQPLNPDLPDLPNFTVDHPISTALSPDGSTLLILTSGYNRNFDAKGKRIPEQSSEYVFVYDVKRAAAPVKRQVLKVPNSFAGIAWAPDGKHFYVSGGEDDSVHVFSLAGQNWAESENPISLAHKEGLGVPWVRDNLAHPNRPVVAGIAVNASGTRLAAANYENDSVSLVDLTRGHKVTELDLRPGKANPAKSGVPGGEFPYWIVFKGDDKAYVSSLRDREIVILDLRSRPVVAGRIKLHGQPNQLILNKAQTLLFAAADNSDSVVIVDTRTDQIVAEIKTTAPPAIFPNRAGFKGSNPNGLALSPDEQTLYVTNGGTNSIAVIRLARDPDDSQVIGLIPTGWYPTSVSMSQDGSTLYVVNGKSVPGPNPHGCRNEFSIAKDHSPCSAAQQYVLQLEKGGFGVIPRPDPATLKQLTAQVAANNHFLPAQKDEKEKAVFDFLRQHIHHVIYIVKENRTYDQVLGDLEKGNGDPSLNLFPEALAPNHHELARRFVTLDNFYDSGEVSGNGWNWSTAARATDVTEKTIPINYASRGMSYDVEGVNRGINTGATKDKDRNIVGLADAKDQLPGSADVAAPDGPEDEAGAGYLWDQALRAKLSIRNYGFFGDLSHYSTAPGMPSPVPLLHDPAATGTRVMFPTKSALWEITDPYFRSFDQRFADYWRFKEWEREFDQFARKDNLPALELLRIEHDHFGEFADADDGLNTVETQFADNDYALGLVAEKIAHSRYAGDTLIFVVEDDAQNGPDHVDAHRSLAYVIGPYVKHRAVISSRYTTVSMLRTIEEVLGLGPLGLNDAVQPPMTDVFSEKETGWSYSARMPDVLRTSKLPLPATTKQTGAANSLPGRDAAYWIQNTIGFDFSAEDKLDSAAFNLVLWKGIKGDDQPYPSDRDGADLSKDRAKFLRRFEAEHIKALGPR